MLRGWKKQGVPTIAAALLVAACGGGGGSAGSVPGASSNTAGAPADTGAVTSASAVSVSIGFDGTVGAAVVDGLKYGKRFVVTVVDQLGRPVLGARVEPVVQMAFFYKGFYTRDANNEINGGAVVECAAEDLDNDDILDPGEDRNQDGLLTPPRSSVAIVTTNGTYLTDSTGSVVFELQYPKNYATWITPRLIVTASVTGTEGRAQLQYRTTFAAGDETQPGAPFLESPFSPTGSATLNPSCTNNL